AGDDIALADAANLARIALHDGLTQRHLAVAGDHHLAALAHGDDRRAVHDDFITHKQCSVRAPKHFAATWNHVASHKCGRSCCQGSAYSTFMYVKARRMQTAPDAHLTGNPFRLLLEGGA